MDPLVHNTRVFAENGRIVQPAAATKLFAPKKPHLISLSLNLFFSRFTQKATDRVLAWLSRSMNPQRRILLPSAGSSVTLSQLGSVSINAHMQP